MKYATTGTNEEVQKKKNQLISLINEGEKENDKITIYDHRNDKKCVRGP